MYQRGGEERPQRTKILCGLFYPSPTVYLPIHIVYFAFCVLGNFLIKCTKTDKRQNSRSGVNYYIGRLKNAYKANIFAKLLTKMANQVVYKYSCI